MNEIIHIIEWSNICHYCLVNGSILIRQKKKKWHGPPLCVKSNIDDICNFLPDLLLPDYRWGVNWCCECSCADYWTVEVLNQTASLLLITHNATNSHVPLSPFFPQPSINILAVVQKEEEKKRKNNLHTIITVGWEDCLQMFVLIIMGAEAGLP